jgi:hypothetical protein
MTDQPALSELCQKVESTIKQVESSYRKKYYREKAKCFVETQKIKPASWTLKLFNISRFRKRNSNGFIEGFKGSPIIKSTNIVDHIQVSPVKSSFKYISSPRTSPNLICKSISTMLKPKRPNTNTNRRPASSAGSSRFNRTTRIRKRATAATVATIGNTATDAIVRPVSASPAVVLSSPCCHTSPTKLLNHPLLHEEPNNARSNGSINNQSQNENQKKNQTQKEKKKLLPSCRRTLKGTASFVKKREESFHQHFRKIAIVTNDQFVVQGVPQKHRVPRKTTPRTPRYRVPQTSTNHLGSTRYMINENGEMIIQVPTVKRPGKYDDISNNKKKLRKKKKKKKKKKKMVNDGIMRVVVKITPPGCAANNANDNNTRLRNNEHWQGEKKMTYRVTSPEFDETNNDVFTTTGSPWEDE